MKHFTALLLVGFFLTAINLHANDRQLSNAYKNQQSDIQVKGSGTVLRVLPDDNGSRHQKFILRLARAW